MTKQFRLLHSSDWHIGMTRRHLAEDSRAVYRDSRLDAVERLCTLTHEHQVDLLVVAGDVFDGHQLATSMVVACAEVLHGATCPVVLVPGNHDAYRRDSVYRSPAFVQHLPDNVVVATTCGVLHPVPECTLIVGPYTDRYPSRNPLLVALEQEEKDGRAGAGGQYRIAVGHGAVDCFAPSLEESTGAEVLPVAELDDLVVRFHLDYVAMGDRHSVTEVGDTGRVWYSGSPEVTNFDDVEENSGQALLVTLDGMLVSIEPVQVGKWVFHTEWAEVTSRDDVQRLVEKIEPLPEKRRTAVRLALNATLPVEEMMKVEASIHKWKGMFAGFQLWESHSRLTILPSSEDIFANLGGYAIDAAEELMKAADDGDGTARQALTLLYRLAAVESGAQ